MHWVDIKEEIEHRLCLKIISVFCATGFNGQYYDGPINTLNMFKDLTPHQMCKNPYMVTSIDILFTFAINVKGNKLTLMNVKNKDDLYKLFLPKYIEYTEQERINYTTPMTIKKRK